MLLQQQLQIRHEQQLERRRQQPAHRLEEYFINSLRRRYSRGEITREAVEQIIEGQHWQIQQLILPDLHQDRERTYPEGWLSRQQYRRRRWRAQHPLPTAALTNIPDAEVVLISDDDGPSLHLRRQWREQHPSAAAVLTNVSHPEVVLIPDDVNQAD